MGIKATALKGWERFTPQILGNDKDPEPVTCECRPLTPDLDTALMFAGSGAAADGRRKLDISMEQQRAILTQCARNLVNYEGTDGEGLDAPIQLLGLRAGEQGAKIATAIINRVLSLTWTRTKEGQETLGKSEGSPDS